jgi:hypothetical protein
MGMIVRSKRHRLLPLLAVGLTLAMTASVQAQERPYEGSGTTASLQVNFGTSPHWTSVRGTRVREVRASERPDYDLFRYGGRYYAYHQNRWYSSHRGQGQYNAMDDRAVPQELSRVPKDHWRNYPAGWNDMNRNHADEDHQPRR